MIGNIHGKEIREDEEVAKMKPFTALTVFALLSALSGSGEAQFLRGLANLFRAPLGGFNLFGNNDRFKDDGTQKPVATGRDELLPSDCGRNTKTGRGKLCFPDGKLCQESKWKNDAWPCCLSICSSSSCSSSLLNEFISKCGSVHNYHYSSSDLGVFKT